MEAPNGTNVDSAVDLGAIIDWYYSNRTIKGHGSMTYVFLLVAILSNGKENIVGKFEDEEACVRASELRPNLECVGTWSDSV